MRARIAAAAIAVALASSFAKAAPRADGDPSKYGWLTRYSSTNGAANDPRFASLARSVAPPFDPGPAERWRRLSTRFVAGLGGPPDPIRIVDDRYLVMGACIPHDCAAKSFLWIDPIEDVRVGAIATVSYGDRRADLLVFSRSLGCARLTAAFRSALADWIATHGMIVVRSIFVDPAGRVDAGCRL